MKKIPVERALLAYGFMKSEETFTLQKELPCGLLLAVTVQGGEMKDELTDPLTGDPYILHRVEGATGAFVGEVREELAAALEEIEKKCFLSDPFGSEQPRMLSKHILETYGDEPEFLWEQFPSYAIWRRKDNNKWYALTGQVERNKLGLEGKETVDILDFRMEPAELDALVDGKKYFRGWHMNKKHWCTVLLDGSVSFAELTSLVEESNLLAKEK